MKIIIKRWGNSAGLPLSETLRRHLCADIGDKLHIQMIDEGLLIRATQTPPYTLEELLSSCTQTLGLDAEDIAWLHDNPVGKEMLS